MARIHMCDDCGKLMTQIAAEVNIVIHDLNALTDEQKVDYMAKYDRRNHPGSYSDGVGREICRECLAKFLVPPKAELKILTAEEAAKL